MSSIVCVPKSLSPAQAAIAVRRSIEINPANADATRTVVRTTIGRRGGPRRLTLLVGNRWPAHGVHLTVQFLDNPSKELRAKILLHMNAWRKTANIRFEETRGAGMVRIARLDQPEDMAGYWSYVGTEILGIDDDEPTFNLEGFTMRTSDAEFRRVVRHEAGHTLGFDHEHMRAELVKKIDRQKAIAYFDRTEGWTKEETIEQVLTPLSAKSIMGTTEADPVSIMCYEIPADITKDGKPIRGGNDINKNDYRFAGKIYPKPPDKPVKEKHSARRGVVDFRARRHAGFESSSEVEPREEPDLIQRTPHMDLSPEPPVALDTFIDVHVYADKLQPRAGEEVEDIEIERIAGQDEYAVGVWLVASKHFKVVGKRLKTLIIKAGEDISKKVTFKVQVVAETANQQNVRISAMFDYDGRPCGRVTREFGKNVEPPKRRKNDSTPPKRPPDDLPPSAKLAIDPTAALPDLIIDISDPDKTLQTFDCRFRSHLLPAYKAGVTGKWKLPSATRDLVKDFFDDFTTCFEGDRLDALRGAGVNLFDSGPDKFKEIFWELIDGGTKLRTISITSEDPHIPWELMIPRRIKNGQEERRNPLGQDYSIGRWLHVDHVMPSQRVKLRGCRVFSPNYKGNRILAKAKVEAKMVLALFVPGQLITPAVLANLKQAMKEGGASVLHFICHGTSSTTVAQRLLLEDDVTLSSTQIDGAVEFATAFKETKPLVFLNACEVGSLKPALVGVGGFAKSFIRAGASCVIAPLWSVKDTFAHEVAKDFYETMKKNPTKSFAEIVSSIRAKAYEESSGGEDTYAAYCFYGDPLAVRAHD